MTAEAISRHLLTVGTITPALLHGTALLRDGRGISLHHSRTCVDGLGVGMGETCATVHTANLLPPIATKGAQSLALNRLDRQHDDPR